MAADNGNRIPPAEVSGTGNRVYTRREFGELLLGAGAVIVGAAALPGNVHATGPTPRRGGAVKIALNSQGTNDTFDGAKILHPGDYLRCSSVYNYLTRLDSHGRAQPELAESFEPNASATRWVLRIRKDIKFHDGAPLTMEDVAFSILRHKEDRVVSNAKQLAGNIKAVKIDGPNTVVVELAEPDADLPVLIGTFQFTIVKKGTYDFATPVGTGAYKVKEFSPGVRTICVRNDNYWKPGQPYLDQFELFAIVDQVARANALLSGDVQMAIDIRGPGIDQLTRSAIASPLVSKAPRYTAIQAAVDMAPGSNPDLGLALTYLIDRERVLKTVLRDNGVIGNDHPIMNGSPYYDAMLPPRSLDRDKAKFHLARSGIGSSPVPVHVSDASAFSVEIGQLLQREAAGVGLNLDLRREPADSYWSAVAGKKPFFATTFNPRPTYNMLLNLTWKSGAAWNFSHYTNKNLDALIDKARVTLDEGQRKGVYAEIQAIIHNSGALVLPCFITYVDGISRQVQGLTSIPVGPLGGLNFTDSVWLKG